MQPTAAAAFYLQTFISKCPQLIDPIDKDNSLEAIFSKYHPNQSSPVSINIAQHQLVAKLSQFIEAKINLLKKNHFKATQNVEKLSLAEILPILENVDKNSRQVFNLLYLLDGTESLAQFLGVNESAKFDEKRKFLELEITGLYDTYQKFHNIFRQKLNTTNEISALPPEQIQLAINHAGANFSKANLSGTNFRGANLRGVNFSGANLTDVDFTDADLTGAIFDGLTICFRTNFTNTKCAITATATSFNNANFSGANFSGATFIETDFQGAIFNKETNFDATTKIQGAMFVEPPQCPTFKKASAEKITYITPQNKTQPPQQVSGVTSIMYKPADTAPTPAQNPNGFNTYALPYVGILGYRS